MGLAAAGSAQKKNNKNKKQPKLLSPPVPEKCSSRPKHFNRGGHSYFFSKDEPGFEDLKGDWLEGRNFCREYCMDLVSLETEAENTFFTKFIISGPQVGFVTSRVVTAQTCSQSISTGGSGLGRIKRLQPQTQPPQTGATSPGLALDTSKYLNLTMPRRISTARWSLVLDYSTISMRTVSNGTTLLATTLSPSCAKTLTPC